MNYINVEWTGLTYPEYAGGDNGMKVFDENRNNSNAKAREYFDHLIMREPDGGTQAEIKMWLTDAAGVDLPKLLQHWKDGKMIYMEISGSKVVDERTNLDQLVQRIQCGLRSKESQAAFADLKSRIELLEVAAEAVYVTADSSTLSAIDMALNCLQTGEERAR